jgi:GAF domain-containing protein
MTFEPVHLTAQARSLTLAAVSSLLAVPLELTNRILGLICLYSSNPKSRFDEDHIQLLAGIAGIAAAAWIVFAGSKRSKPRIAN